MSFFDIRWQEFVVLAIVVLVAVAIGYLVVRIRRFVRRQRALRDGQGRYR